MHRTLRSLGHIAPHLVAVTLLLGAIHACGTGSQSQLGARWEAVYDTIGDTVVVRTVAGSLWGDTARLVPEVTIGVLDGPEEYMFGQIVSMALGADGTIYVMDRQVPALRVYNPDGSYRATFGREGAGPGEYRRPDGGMGVLSDGRIVLRERGRPGKIADTSASFYGSREEQYKGYLAAEFTYPILPKHKGGAGWFYSLPKHDNLCHPADKLYNDYVGALKYGNIFSIDVGPNYEGQLRDIDVKTLKEIGKMIKERKVIPKI